MEKFQINTIEEALVDFKAGPFRIIEHFIIIIYQNIFI